MKPKSWIFCRYGSPTAINHPKTSPNIDKSTFKCTHCNKTDPTSYQHFVINDNNRDQRKKDSKKTSTATIAEIKTEANVAEKASALVVATDHGANGTQPRHWEGSLTLTDTLNLDSVLVVPSLDYNLFKNTISYWGEAITSAAYLINRVPSSSINFQTPLQALTNVVVAPTVPNLPPLFLVAAFVHLHKHQRTKLTSHALQCVFVGYALHKKDIDVTILQLDKWEYHKEIQTLDYDYHISEEDESGQSELVNQEVGELDMSGQQFGSEDVFTEIPNQSSSVEGVLNLEPDPFMNGYHTVIIEYF
ncbi:hypothetical protein CK203_111890 [Vitis vinifera]|uniref:Retroviral polymerase SH3-like domain-containing protein n=1 Tax=Vitis vinifera TaxID=29760 RepID=A0A438C4M0_VITVI|nr:hypothetical protein CK203_111890 [Vitis vinifera]